MPAILDLPVDRLVRLRIASPRDRNVAAADGGQKPADDPGAILGFACPAPTACFEIYTAWKEGDEKLSASKQERINAAARKVVGESGPAGVKYAMDLNGYYGGIPRLPLLPPRQVRV